MAQHSQQQQSAPLFVLICAHILGQWDLCAAYNVFFFRVVVVVVVGTPTKQTLVPPTQTHTSTHIVTTLPVGSDVRKRRECLFSFLFVVFPCNARVSFESGDAGAATTTTWAKLETWRKPSTSTAAEAEANFGCAGRMLRHWLPMKRGIEPSVRLETAPEVDAKRGRVKQQQQRHRQHTRCRSVCWQQLCSRVDAACNGHKVIKLKFN